MSPQFRNGHCLTQLLRDLRLTRVLAAEDDRLRLEAQGAYVGELLQLFTCILLECREGKYRINECTLCAIIYYINIQ